MNWILKILLKEGVPKQVAYRGLILFNTNELVVPFAVMMLPRNSLAEHTRCVLGVACLVAAMPLAGTALAVTSDPHHMVLLVVSILASYGGILVWVLHYTITPTLFPSDRRGTGFGTCMMCCRVGYIVGPLVGSHLVGGSQSSALLWACSAVYIVIALLALFLHPASGES